MQRERKINDRILALDEEKFNQYNQGEQIPLFSREFSVQLTKDILNDDQYNLYIERLFNDEIAMFIYGLNKNGDITKMTSLNKVQLIKLFIKLNELYPLEGISLERFNKYLNSVSYENFINKYQNEIYTLNIDNNSYSYTVKDFISFLSIDDDTLESRLNNGYYDEKFLYALSKYFNDNKIIKHYLLPDQYIDRLRNVEYHKYIDFQAVNDFLVTKDPNIDKVIVNEQLKDFILSDMDPNLTTLEKALYIYIKLCKTLTYDDQFYVYNQRGEVAKKHEDLNNVINITPSNNLVVCYDFNIIYGKFLQDLGLNFKTDSAIVNGFGGGHASLEFRCGKFIIKADSVTGILDGDLVRAKLDLDLKGIYCKNTSLETKEEFTTSLEKVYNSLKKEETFEDVLTEYENTTTNLINVPLENRFQILLNKANSTHLMGIDNIGYIIHLRNIMFNETERKKNFNLVFIKNKNDLDENKKITISTIFVLNDKDIEIYTNDNNYYHYHPSIPLACISLETLQELFDNNKLAYINNKSPRIPGLKEQGGMRL